MLNIRKNEHSLRTEDANGGQNAGLCQKVLTKNVRYMGFREVLMNGVHHRQHGFSLIELLLVVAIIGVVATLAVPALRKATVAAENGGAFSTMRTMSSQQMNYYTQNNRYATLPELNSVMSNAVGTTSGSQVVRGKFVFEMTPTSASDPVLRNQYTITATRNVPSEGVIYKYELTQNGEMKQILP